DLARVLLQRGSIAEAEALLLDALEKHRALLGEESIAVANDRTHLASARYMQGRRDEAEALRRQVVEAHRKADGEKSVGYALALQDLAFLVQERRGSEEAQKLLRESLDILRAYGADDSQLARPMMNLGRVLAFEGRHLDADQQFREALAISRKTYGEEHP